MLTLRTPYKYISGKNILNESGKYIAEIGKTALIISGKTALEVVRESLFPSLEKYGVRYAAEKFSGYPTYAAIDRFSESAKDFYADVIIAVGGGKVMDTAKGVGQKLRLPVISVPTIAATCAAWAACSIIYTEEGSFAGVLDIDNSPRLILIDLTLIANAPVRYLNAGIADTIAKWYETEPNLKKVSELNLQLEVKTAELAFEILQQKALKVSNEVTRHEISGDLSDVVDSIVLLAGLVGSTKADNFYGGFAHPFYNSITQIPQTRDKLHGEKVSFGLLVQSVLEHKSSEEIADQLNFLLNLNQPVTLEKLGIVTDVEKKVDIIATPIPDFLLYYKAQDHKLTKEEIVDAIFKADAIGIKALKNKKLAPNSY